MDGLPTAVAFAPVPTLARLVLALAVGLFVGLEREHRGKEAGLRTFGFTGLLGALGGLLGNSFALVTLALLGILIGFLNWKALRADQGAELTTSAALLVTGFAGVLCGLGHTFTPVAVGVISAALLAWKEPLAGFSIGLSEEELRSAILLAILAFVVYPILPDHPVDPWGLFVPRTAWATVILIAAMGFVSYVLLRLYGTRGIELAGFLGGLVNSTVTVTELGLRLRETGARFADVAYRGIMFSTAAMIARNAILLGILAVDALRASASPFVFMLVASVALALVRRRGDGDDATPPRLQSPFSLRAAIEFGALFVVIQAAGTLAQQTFGTWGFYATSLVGGVISSASAVASGGVLAAHGQIPDLTAGTGAVLASLASAAVNLPLVARTSRNAATTRRIAVSFVVIVAVTGLGAMVQRLLPHAG
jgi:uncharacterized membrane protein (DUF4010 family)